MRGGIFSVPWSRSSGTHGPLVGRPVPEPPVRPTADYRHTAVSSRERHATPRDATPSPAMRRVSSACHSEEWGQGRPGPGSSAPPLLTKWGTVHARVPSEIPLEPKLELGLGKENRNPYCPFRRFFLVSLTLLREQGKGESCWHEAGPMAGSSRGAGIRQALGGDSSEFVPLAVSSEIGRPRRGQRGRVAPAGRSPRRPTVRG